MQCVDDNALSVFIPLDAIGAISTCRDTARESIFITVAGHGLWFKSKETARAMHGALLKAAKIPLVDVDDGTWRVSFPVEDIDYIRTFITDDQKAYGVEFSVYLLVFTFAAQARSVHDTLLKAAKIVLLDVEDDYGTRLSAPIDDIEPLHHPVLWGSRFCLYVGPYPLYFETEVGARKVFDDLQLSAAMGGMVLNLNTTKCSGSSISTVSPFQ
jgi:hypothetical protein